MYRTLYLMDELSRNSGAARTHALLLLLCETGSAIGPRLEPGVCLVLFLPNQQVLVRS